MYLPGNVTTTGDRTTANADALQASWFLQGFWRMSRAPSGSVTSLMWVHGVSIVLANVRNCCELEAGSCQFEQSFVLACTVLRQEQEQVASATVYSSVGEPVL